MSVLDICQQKRIVAASYPVEVVCGYELVSTKASNMSAHARKVHGNDKSAAKPLSEEEKSGNFFPAARKYFGDTAVNGNKSKKWGPLRKSIFIC